MPLTPEMRRGVDQIRDYLYGGGYPDPVSNAEQLSFLFFFYLIEGLNQENADRARATRRPYVNIFDGDSWTLKNPLNAPGTNQKTVPRTMLQWSVWARGMSGSSLVTFVRDEVFSFYAEVAERSAVNFMDGARLVIDEPTVLVQVLTLIDRLRLDEADADTKGDLFEHILKQIKQAGELGQFRTPRHIIRTVVALLSPKIGETIYDPAAGTAGFLVAAFNHIRLTNSANTEEVEVDGKLTSRGHGERLTSAQWSELNNSTFYGNDVDSKMVHLATMNLTLRGLANVRILKRNVLTSNLDRDEKEELGLPLTGYRVVLANPPFSGRIDKDRIIDNVKVGRTTATEILFLKYMMDSLDEAGRCGVIVPEGVVRGTSAAHMELRRILFQNFEVLAVIGLPHFVFKPYASVATMILIFQRGKTSKRVWMYHLDNDGYTHNSLRDPSSVDDIPDLIEQYNARDSSAYVPVTGRHGYVSLSAIIENNSILVPKLYLRSTSLVTRYPLVPLSQLCNIKKGRTPASAASNGDVPFVTTSETLKRTGAANFHGPAVCVPLVSSTGHGHASINKITYIEGDFDAATIVAVLEVLDTSILAPRYLYCYLAAMKDEALVSLMGGAANVSLSLTKIGSVKIPLPSLEEQRKLIADLSDVEDTLIKMNREASILEDDRLELLAALNSEFGGAL